jgi:transposase
MKELREIETRAAAEVLTELDKAELKQFRNVLERGTGVSAASSALSEVVRH